MMKKIFNLLVILAITLSTQAQYNIGGTPKALTQKINDKLINISLSTVSEEWKTEHEAAASHHGTVDPIAKNIATDLSLTNSGTWTVKKNGDRIWRLQITAENAIGINALYKDFYLPEGAELFIYNPDHTQVLGAFTSKNNTDAQLFSTEIIFGNSLILEYFEPKEVAGEGSFTIEKVGSFFKDLVHYDNKGFGDSENCQVNINCSEGSSWQDEKNGVARILVTSSSGQGWCSGSLVNNTNQDNHPYFLTAYHCGNNSSTANFNQWIFYFDYEFTNCSGTFEPSSNSIVGATVVSRSNDLNTSTTSSDFLLLDLTETLPTGVYFNGWNISGAATQSGVGIHHPAGDVKKISTFNSNMTSVGVAFSGAGYAVISGTTHWNFSWAATANGHGVTEGGSSGSPLFNNNGEIIGTLSGGGSSCNNTNASDQYGKMSFHWTSNASANNRQLQPWLDPTNSGVTTLAGKDESGTTNPTLDASLESFASPATEICSFDFTPSVVLKNNGSINIVSATITYQLNSGANQTTNWTGNITTGNSETVVLSALSSTQASNTITATVSNINGTTDANAANNSTNQVFTSGVNQSLPFLERYEGGQTENTISVNNSDDAETWSFFNQGSYGTSSNCMFIDNWDYDAVGQYDWFITPSYDFTNAVDEELYFDLAYTYYQQTNGTNQSFDSLGIAASIDCGENYYWLWRQGGLELATLAGGFGEEFVPTNDQWETRTISLSELNGEASVQFAFIAINGYGNNLYVDNIGIGKVLLSVDDNSWASDVTLYPNPANTVLNIDLSSLESKAITYSVYNSLGQTMHKSSSSNSTESVDLSSYVKGVYYIKLVSEGQQKIMKFIVE